ncbi:MAG: hypothetical protein ABSB35_30800 [Bryobacteraceae bacterium]
MLRVAAFVLAFAAAVFGATERLYLKDGTYQLTNEYQVLSDRVRFYSTERSQWEEIPLEMVDLNRTKKEVADHESEVQAETKAQSEEDAAERAERQEIERVPVAAGAYYIHDDKMEPLTAAESKVVSDTKRTVLKFMSPLPMVSGKATLEIDGDAAAFRVTQNRPEFYFRLSNEEQFGIIKLTPKKGGKARIVENITIVPVSKEVIEEQKTVAIFKRQVGDLLFKIWPEEALEPGEYALIEYTPVEMSDKSVNLQVFDFSVGAAH